MSNLDSLRELLIKKADGDSTLQTIISIIKDEILTDKLLESLEKMARPQATMGRSANAGVTAYGNQMKNKDVEQMRDALAHHVNHYKSALKNGNRSVADQHLNRIVPMMHLAGKAAAHSNGQLGLDYTPMEPWETNYTTDERRPETGKLKEGTKGLRRRLNGTPRDKNPRSVPDYHYLEMAPHEKHPDSARSPHKGGYPFEEIQLGNPAKIDAKEAYLHSEDIPPQNAFVPHPFDQHPIHGVHDESDPKKLNLENLAQNISDWHGSEPNAKWMQNIKDAHAKDPEAFKARGKAKPGHHFDGIPLQQQPHAGPVNAAALPPELAAKFAQPAAAPQPVAQPTAAPAGVNTAHLPPELRAKLGIK